MNESQPQDIPNPKDQNRSRVRASDAERESVADRLRTAVTDGRLSLEEGDERLAALYAMKFRDELPSLTRDLPGDPDDQPRNGPWGGWGSSWSARGEGRDRDDEQAPAGPGWGGGPGRGWAGRGHGHGGPGDWGARGGPGWGMRRAPWPFRVFPVVMLLIIVGAIVSAVGGHFFWPIIPLFLLFTFTRFAFFRACRRGWTRS